MMHTILFISLSLINYLFHPVHVSITNINLNTELNTTEISFQFFGDDFKNTVLLNTGTTILINNNQEPDEKGIRAISNYIFSNFGIVINDKIEMSFDFQYIKRNEESIWVYYKGKDIKGIIKNITIDNTLMLDIYPDQKNLLILEIDGVEKGYTLNLSKNNINVNL